jgi:DNA-binding NarL/FixJ family response regulator
MMAKTIPVRLLVIDQDTRYGEWLKHHLGVICPESPIGLMPLSEFNRWSEELSGRDCDVLMLAASFGASPEDPEAHGLELLRRLRDKAHFPAVIAVAEDGNELTAVRALQLGAVDYLPKRLLTAERLKTSVKLALRMLEKRVARRIANLVHTSEAEDKVVADEARPTSVDVKSTTGTRAALAARAASVAAAADVSAGTQTNEAAAIQESAAEQLSLGLQSSEQPGGEQHGMEQPAAVKQASTADHDDTLGTDEPDAESGDSGSQPAWQGRGALNSDSSTNIKPPTVSGSTAPVPAAKAPGGEFMPANFIPGYTIHATIGESEKAAVYVATSDVRGENVALKVSKTLRDEAAGRQFLEREYTAIVAIRDPSVVQIYDYGVHSGYEYLVMEYLPRGDLKARMQQGMTEQEAIRYVSQIADALKVVHSAGLLHRDLKPPNVMLRENGEVALIDFGLARALDGSTPSTRTGVLRGSPYYMSPEQALGEVLDARSDFYSLGIMFYEMLTGRKPYTGGSAMDVLQQHVNAPLPMLPKPLAHHEPVLLKLMAKSREDRFARAEEIVTALGPRPEPVPTVSADDDSEQVESSAA